MTVKSHTDHVINFVCLIVNFGSAILDSMLSEVQVIWRFNFNKFNNFETIWNIFQLSKHTLKKYGVISRVTKHSKILQRLSILLSQHDTKNQCYFYFQKFPEVTNFASSQVTTQLVICKMYKKPLL